MCCSQYVITCFDIHTPPRGMRKFSITEPPVARTTCHQPTGIKTQSPCFSAARLQAPCLLLSAHGSYSEKVSPYFPDFVSTSGSASAAATVAAPTGR